MNHLKPYPDCKDSGVPWLGEVPKHWDVNRGKWLFEKMERPYQENDNVVTCFRDGMVTLRKNRRARVFTESLKEIGYQGIRKGDLVIHAMDAFAGAIGVSDSDGKGTPVYQVLAPTERSDSYYYAYILREMARSQWILALAKGIRERSTDFRYGDFASQYLPLPRLPEQITIVRYLDYMDRRIRRYINAKKKLIALLKEKKQAIINQAVTRGLDPSVRLKPSGIEWLGDIPEHWEVRRLKYLANISTGGKDTVNRVDDGAYPFFVRSQKIEHINTFSFDGEAVLTAGDGAGVAKVFHYVNGRFDYHQRVYKFSNFLRVKGKFFFYYLKTNLRFEALDASAKSTVDSLRLPMLQNFAVTLPPIDEQENIVGWIELKSIPFDAAIERARRQIELLREYRSRLIADVVTGKLDVREAAASLPREAEEDAFEEAESLSDNGAAVEDGEEVLTGVVDDD